MNLSTTANVLQQSIQPAIITGDISRAFLTLHKSPRVCMSELEYYYCQPDGTPSFLPEEGRQEEPEIFARKQASYSSSDLPIMFNHVVQHSVKMYKAHYPNTTNNNNTVTLPQYNFLCNYDNEIEASTLKQNITTNQDKIFKKIKKHYTSIFRRNYKLTSIL